MRLKRGTAGAIVSSEYPGANYDVEKLKRIAAELRAQSLSAAAIAEELNQLIRPLYRSIDGGGLPGLACRSLGLARSTREEAADVHCGIGSSGGQRLRMGDYVTGMEPTGGSVAAGRVLELTVLVGKTP